MLRSLYFHAAFFALLLLQETSGTTTDVTAIVRHSVESNLRNSSALEKLNFFTVDRQADGTTRTFEEMMLFGSRYSLLTALNGKPLPPERQRAEERKLEEEKQKRANESPHQRAKRVNKYERERQRDQIMLNEMANAFDFTLAGEQLLNGHEVYVLQARPRRGYRPPNTRAKVLTGMEGTLWIEKKRFQWVKVEAEVIRPVSIEGFLATVQPGTRFELVQAPFSEDVWLPTHFSMKAKARVLLIFSKADQEDTTYYGYYPAVPEPKAGNHSAD